MDGCKVGLGLGLADGLDRGHVRKRRINNDLGLWPELWGRDRIKDAEARSVAWLARVALGTLLCCAVRKIWVWWL